MKLQTVFRWLVFSLAAIMCFDGPLAAQQPPEAPVQIISQQNLPPPVFGLDNPLPQIYAYPNPFVWDRGYLLGRIVNGRVEGILLKTYEAEAYLGENSSPGGILDQECFDRERENVLRQGLDVPGAKSPTDEQIFSNEQPDLDQAEQSCTIPVNPWPLSSYNRGYETKAARFGEALVVIKYTAIWLHPFLNSDYVLNGIWTIDPEYPLPGRSLDISDRMVLGSAIHYSAGHYDGLVVKASIHGVVRFGGRIIVQVGASGRYFVQLAVTDRQLFDFIVDCMSTGRLIRLYYYQIYTPQDIIPELLHNYGTTKRVYKVELLSAATPPVVPPSTKSQKQ